LRILYASERPPYPYFLGGAARSAHYLLSTLGLRFDVQCVAVGSRQFGGHAWSAADIQDPERLNESLREDDGNSLAVQCGGYPVRLLDDFYDQLPRLIEFYAPDVVWTQLDGFERIALIARRLGRRAIVYLRDAEHPPASVRKVAAARCGLLCNSEFMAKMVRRLTGRPAGVIYPSLETPVGVSADPGGFITMINPHLKKGIDTFLAVAQLLPDERFLLVESWKLDPESLAALQQRLAALPNVNFMHRVADVGAVYSRTRLLLVPSLWEEAFGRVVIEAQSCGIPVVASHRGGLPESVGEGGLCVADHANVSAWIAAIRSVLEDPAAYRNLSARALAHAGSEQFTARFAAQRFLELCGDQSISGSRAQ
jgi:glycosyltransferase involved in cell wall biosynthesis